MPIRPENAARYPANWKSEIRPRILARAERDLGGRMWPCCEQCGVPNHELIIREGDGWRLGTPFDDDAIVVVLTIAHLDHQPENCDDDNLRAWCQKCHNSYDMPMRRRGIKQRAREMKACGDLFEVT